MTSEDELLNLRAVYRATIKMVHDTRKWVREAEEIDARMLGVSHPAKRPTAEEQAKAKRREQEAALVALVSAVPKGLDANAWRAAVLSVHECQSRYDSPIIGDHFVAWLMHSLREDIDDCDAGTPYANGYHAYVRALTPSPKVQPERKKRGPFLTVDDGWHDD